MRGLGDGYRTNITRVLRNLKPMKKEVLLCCMLVNAAFGSYGQRLNDSLRRVLDTVAEGDALYRDQLEGKIEQYGAKSAEVRALFERMRVQDSVNQVKVSAILDRFGWVGPEVVGEEGNSTLFFVVQHAELPMQLEYLPMMRAAVKNGKAKPRHLALLEDRVALRQGKRQVYGSQVGWEMKTNWYYVLPLADPDHVDQRRAAVGLMPLADYLENWQMKWDVEQYKKDLPRIDSLWRGQMGK